MNRAQEMLGFLFLSRILSHHTIRIKNISARILSVAILNRRILQPLITCVYKKLKIQAIPFILKSNIVMFGCMCVLLTGCVPAVLLVAGAAGGAVATSKVKENDQGLNVNSACSSVFPSQSWGQIACILGGSLINMLDQEDQRELAGSTEEAIATGRDSGWSNPYTGVRGEVKVTGTKVNRQTSEVAVQETVQEVPPLDLIAGEFNAVSKTNIFAGPGTNYRSVGSLTKGQNVQVIAKVQNRGWYLLSQDGIGSGYVSSNALKPTGRIKVSGNSPKPQYQGQKKVKRVRVKTKQTCKTIEQKVTLEDGSTHGNSIEACPEPDGTWDVA